MGLLGKIVGGTIGFAMAGPLGAIAGAAIGHHAFDTDGQRYHTAERARLSQGEEAQLTFFVAAFSMIAKLAKADGRVSEEEIVAVENFMVYDLNLDPASRKLATNIFHAAIESQDNFNDFAAQFYSLFRTQYQMLDLMIDILLRVSVADGTLSQSEEKLILSAVRIFNFSDEKYNKLKSKTLRNIMPSLNATATIQMSILRNSTVSSCLNIIRIRSHQRDCPKNLQNLQMTNFGKSRKPMI
jgi:DnaJ like chaperone protein